MAGTAATRGRRPPISKAGWRAYQASAPRRALSLALRRLRREAGLTVEALAARSRLGVEQVETMEMATTRWPADGAVRAYAKPLGSAAEAELVALLGMARSPAVAARRPTRGASASSAIDRLAARRRGARG